MLLFEKVAPVGIELEMSDIGGDMPVVSFAGTLSHIITDQEANAFGMGNFTDRQQIAHLLTNEWFPGTDRWCDYTGLHDDVKDYNIYQQEGWSPVSCIYTPVYAQVLSYNMQPDTIGQNNAINYDTNPVIVQATSAAVVTDIAESNWTNTYSFEVGQSITYGINILGLNGQGQVSMNYTGAFGKAGSESKPVSLTFGPGVTIQLAGGYNVDWWIAFTKGTVTYEVTYEVTLSGILCWAYDKKFEGHWFYGYDINVGLGMVNKPTRLIVKQQIEVAFNTGASIVVGMQQQNP